MTYDVGQLSLAAVVDSMNRSTAHAAGAKKDFKDALRVVVGGSYDFGR